ncbi:hypothetical protein, partial [Tenacibaculum finnmarkense]|uniref:hypothetical protein n=1 Tax=Tenacibaculum finnmarkense TaxID=2781243 RepID=UPI001EFB3D7A
QNILFIASASLPTKILRGFSISFLFTKLVARKTQQTIYKPLATSKKNYETYFNNINTIF